MKTINYAVLFAMAAHLILGTTARANLITSTDSRFGLDSVTIDTSTGLGWLDLSASAGLSYEQVLADTQPGGIYSGYRLAKADEVFKLYADAGIPGAGYYPVSTPLLQSLISLLGPSGQINGHPGLLGLSATSDNGGQLAPAIYVSGLNGMEAYWVNDSTAYGETASYPQLGSWLVSNVPESSGAAVYVLAIAGLIGFRYFLRRQNIA